MMVHRELQLSKYETGGAAVVVDNLRDFVEASARHPRRLIILRAGAAVPDWPAAAARDWPGPAAAAPDWPGPPAAAPATELRRYCLALGGILEYDRASEIRTIRNDPSIRSSTAMSGKPLPLHTDGTFLAHPPERFMLSFSRADSQGGGLSTFMPISDILAAAPDRVIEALLTADFLFPRGYDGDLTDSHVGPVLYRAGSALRIRWRSDDIWRPRVVDSRGTDGAGAVDWLHEFLATSEPYSYLAEDGETLLVPNTVLLHGRTALSPGSQREVLRVWVGAS
jgi:hypothetical protein